ncbi:DUF6894 family protein [Microvirga sp. RSM25]|uniref:DUF6894 family protein n=1 Tax=Microvirga sp. RSM25 TaxID=3273802 RepID=UPI00384C6B1F
MIVLERPATSRFFFNFVSDTEVIRDETGVILSIEGDVVGHIARALEDLYRDGSLAPAEWDGWRIEVADCTGQYVLSISLGSSSQESDNRCPVPRDFKSLMSTGMATSAQSGY